MKPYTLSSFVCISELFIFLLWVWTLLLFFSVHTSEVYPQIWTHQFIGMSVVLLLLALSLPLCTRTEIKVGIYLVQLFLVLVIGLPEGDSVWLELFFTIILVIELVTFFPLSATLVLYGLSIFLLLLMQHNLNIWGRTVEAPLWYNQVNFILVTGFILFLGISLRLAEGTVEKAKVEEQRLDNAVYQLTSANVGFQNYARTSSETSKIDERKRISREIHDTVGYTLVNVMMMAEAASDQVGEGQEGLEKLIQSILEQSQSGLYETRRAVRALREIEQRETGLKLFVQLIDVFQAATGVKVRFEYSDVPSTFGERIDSILYRIIQEGLTNSFRHGKASFVEVFLWRNEGEIGVSIRDNGSGAEGTLKEGVGFAGMRERLSEIEGVVKAHNIPTGFLVDVRIPGKAESIYD